MKPVNHCPHPEIRDYQTPVNQTADLNEEGDFVPFGIEQLFAYHPAVGHPNFQIEDGTMEAVQSLNT